MGGGEDGERFTPPSSILSFVIHYNNTRVGVLISINIKFQNASALNLCLMQKGAHP